MAIITQDSKLCDIVINDPSSITVLNRFNIFLGVGDKTIQDICQEKDLDVNFFSAILNTYIHEDYFPEETLKSYSIGKIIEYINKTNQYYLKFQIPNIERHFSLLITHSVNEKNNLELLLKFFLEVKNELISRIDFDKTQLLFHIDRNTINELDFTNLSENNDNIEDKLNDLINMFVIHLKGEYDVNLCHAVLIAIMSLQKDIKQNNRIRYRILLPILKSMA